MYIANYQLNTLIGNDLSKSIWSFLSRQLNHSKRVKVNYDIVCGGRVHNRNVIVKAYDIDTIIETICEHASSFPNSKSIWIDEVQYIKDRLYKFKLEKEALHEQVIKDA